MDNDFDPNDPSRRQPCDWVARSPLRAAFDIILIIALFASYIPQFRSTFSTRSPSRLPASYILLTLLLVTFLNTSHTFGFVMNDWSSCISIGAPELDTWQRAGAALGIAQVGSLWWCEFINAILWIIAARPGASRTSPFVNVEARTDEDEDDEEEAAEDQTLLGSPADATTTQLFGREISAKQKWYASIAAVVGIFCLSTGLYIFARHISLHKSIAQEAPEWVWDQYKSDAGVPPFITLRVLTMITFPLSFIPILLRLRGQKQTGLDKRGLWMQAGVLVVIGASLTQMLWRWGGFDARGFGMSVWMEGAGTVITLAGVRAGIAWWVGKKEVESVRL